MRQIEPANSEAGLAVHDVPAPRTMPGAERRLLRSRSCVAAVRLTAAVLVLTAASLVLVQPAFAEDGDLLSATLNVTKLATLVWGCQQASDTSNYCSDADILSDDDFIVNDVTYTVTQLYINAGYDIPRMFFKVTPETENQLDGLKIHVGMTEFDFADATRTFGSYEWETSLSWSQGDAIAVRITLVPPNPPTNLTAEVVAPTRISLDWDVAGGSSGLTGWYIERSDDGNEPWTSVVNLINPVRDYWPVTFQSHFNDNTLTPVTTRHYRVRSFNDGGESANSNVVSGTTPTLVPQDAGPLVYGRTDSRLDSLRDQ